MVLPPSCKIQNAAKMNGLNLKKKSRFLQKNAVMCDVQIGLLPLPLTSFIVHYSLSQFRSFTMKYRLITLSDKYRLSFRATTPPCLWTVGWVGCVNTNKRADRNRQPIFVRKKNWNCINVLSREGRFEWGRLDSRGLQTDIQHGCVVCPFLIHVKWKRCFK